MLGCFFVQFYCTSYCNFLRKPFTTQSRVCRMKRKKTFENSVDKGGHAGKQRFPDSLLSYIAPITALPHLICLLQMFLVCTRLENCLVGKREVSW